MTKNYYIINSQTSSINDADDDEILRQAYKISSIDSTNKNINNNNNYQDNNNINAKNYQHNNKYSSRYSTIEQHDRDIDYYPSNQHSNISGIQIHTIGEDYNNDINKNNNKLSYKPTVPTITTTKKTYYSPTVPATTVKTSKYDLEFESSDHLYSANNKKNNKPHVIDTITNKNNNNEETLFNNNNNDLPYKNYENTQIENTTNYNEIKTTQSTPFNSKFDNKISTTINSIELTDKINDSNIILNDFDNYDIESLDLGVNSPEEVLKNYTQLVEISDDNYQGDNNIFIPPTHIIPPFFYYSNIAQHNAVTDNIGENNITKNWFEVPIIFRNDNFKIDNKLNETNEQKYKYVVEDFIATKNINEGFNNTGFLDTENISQPSNIFLPPLLDSLIQNSSDYSNDLTYHEKLVDSFEGESSPYQVTLNITDGVEKLNNDLAKSQEQLKNKQNNNLNNENINFDLPYSMRFLNFKNDDENI